MIFGSYGPSIYRNNPTNTTITRKIGVIYPQALDMPQGISEVINLLAVKLISHCKVNSIPITQEFINRVGDLIKKDCMKSLLNFKGCK